MDFDSNDLNGDRESEQHHYTFAFLVQLTLQHSIYTVSTFMDRIYMLLPQALIKVTDSSKINLRDIDV